ncbi:hypothetical protein MW887_001469 [Aspergillus wentii]|nr:hypothetical protein MW887_001469 [Aspergillus wentii]
MKSPQMQSLSPWTTVAFSALVLQCVIINTATAFNFDPMKVIYTSAPVAKRSNENLQTFTGGYGGSAPAITNTGDSQRPYGVDGDTFPDYDSAAQRSCDNQFNSCQEPTVPLRNLLRQ